MKQEMNREIGMRNETPKYGKAYRETNTRMNTEGETNLKTNEKNKTETDQSQLSRENKNSGQFRKAPA